MSRRENKHAFLHEAAVLKTEEPNIINALVNTGQTAVKDRLQNIC